MAGRDDVRVIKGESCWRRRTRLERLLVIFCCLAGIVCASLVVTVAVMRSQLANKFQGDAEKAIASGDCRTETDKRAADCHPKVCLTPACVHAASRLLDNMDREADPCEDFYTFSCGGFKKRGVPPEKGQLSVLGLIDDDLEQQLHRLLTEGPPPNKEPQHFANVRNLYNLCIDTDKIEKDGTAWLEARLQDAGGWPLLEGDLWDEKNFNWLDTIYKLSEIGYQTPYIVSFSVDTDFKNTSKRLVNVDKASTSVNREYLVEEHGDKIVKAYYEYMVDVAVMMGADRERAKSESRQVLDFEIKLANASLSEEERRDLTQLYNPMTVAEAQERLPVIPWKDYINRLLPENKVQIEENETIVFNDIGFVHQLGPIIDATPKRVLANYLMWRATRFSLRYSPEKFRRRAFQYSSAYSGKTEPEPRWRVCITHVNSNLVIAFSALYVRKYFDESSKKLAMEITNDIKAEMYKTLENVDWMDKHTRQSALEKMEGMMTHIAYPDELLDNTKLAEFYNGLVIGTDIPLLEATLKVMKFEDDFELGRLREPVNKTEWHGHGAASVVNAYYSPIDNAIEFPAGILQGHLFGGGRPRYMNYGTFGFVVAHEITHAFDDRGRLFDKKGNLVDWWDPRTKERFVEKSQCIIDQYASYFDSQVNMTLNGVNTQGENIADNGGIKQAYRAYSRWVHNHNDGLEEQVLPGLHHLTASQLFWISAANSWCSVYRDEDLADSITTDNHSPGEFRVVGSISNMPEFSKDFNCPLGSKMNPIKKCNVW